MSQGGGRTLRRMLGASEGPVYTRLLAKRTVHRWPTAEAYLDSLSVAGRHEGAHEGAHGPHRS